MNMHANIHTRQKKCTKLYSIGNRLKTDLMYGRCVMSVQAQNDGARELKAFDQ